MSLETRMRKLEARAHITEPEPLIITVRVFSAGPLPEPIHQVCPDGRRVTVQYERTEASQATDRSPGPA